MPGNYINTVLTYSSKFSDHSMKINGLLQALDSCGTAGINLLSPDPI